MMATGFLKVKGTQIVDGNDNVVHLFGVSLGGMLNMENFMNGYPGTESHTRAAMRKAMGQENYKFFFDRLIHHFFTENDAQLLRSIGINSVRLPFSYKHFEDDMNPRVLKGDAFKHMDRVIDICAAHGIYVILDMHTAPGCQNPDWHSDNHTSYAAFWDFRDHQDRTVWLWEQIAQRYKDNTWVAGYNPLNEPCDSEQVRVADFYERIEKVLRAIDPNHVLFLDGNTFAMEWKGFKTVLPNSVYSIHDYSLMGFPVGKRYEGTPEQIQKLKQQYDRKCEYHNRHGVPVWVGEFGPTYEPSGPEADEINAGRTALLRAQLSLYKKEQVSWSLWTYKDIGVMGVVSLSPETPWMKLIEPVHQKKAHLQIDGFTARPNEEIDALVGDLAKWIDRVSPTAKKTYPAIWDTKQHIRRNIIQTFLATSYADEFGQLFCSKSKADLEDLAQSYALQNCVPRKDLVESLALYATR